MVEETDKETQRETQRETRREYYLNFPEAPMSDNFKWVDSDNIVHQTTVRAYGPQELERNINEMKKIIQNQDGVPVGSSLPQLPTNEHAPHAGEPAHGDGWWFEIDDDNKLVEKKGKLVMIYRQGTELPEYVPCPRHAGTNLNKKDNESGVWYSHKTDTGWCNADISLTA